MGEALAARALLQSGRRIVGRRVLTSAGEIDLLAEVDGEITACEVKSTLAEPPGADPGRFRPARRLKKVQLARQRRAARLLGCGQARVDLLEVWIGPETGEVRIHHHFRVNFGALSSSEQGICLFTGPLGTFQPRNLELPQRPYSKGWVEGMNSGRPSWPS